MQASSAQTHPVVELVIGHLSRAEAGGYQLSADQLQVVKRSLLGLRLLPELRRAVRELLRFAWLLETQQQSRSLARALVGVARDAVAALIAQGHKLGELGRELEAAAARFARFSGETRKARAPRLGEARPAGSLPLGLLRPVCLR